MACNLFHLRSTFKARSCLLFRKELLCNELFFADDSTKKSNLYETLGISSSATHGEIKKAYYDLTFKYHPDRNENSVIASTKFKEVSEAYEILGNFSLRKKYDKGMPVSHMKKTVAVTVDHKAKYQEFFDSRTVQKDFSDKSKYFDDFANFTEKKESDLHPDKKRKNLKVSSGSQMVVILFVCVLMIAFRQ